jgi:glycosyltransferase involved in cell wall biosynthesis
MKILWAADFDTKEHKGGAQQTNDVMIQAGRKLGHSISLYTGGSLPKSTSSYDVIILNNITKYKKAQIEALTDTGKCIRYEHDYWVAENYPELYKKVIHTVFLSPLHKKTTEEKVGYKINNCSLVPSPIDSDLFQLGEEKEKCSALWVGNICKEKGSDGFIDYAKSNPEYKFYVAGWGSEVEPVMELENVEFLGEMDLKDLVKEYQRCEYFYHRPLWKEPFGRSVIEAYLCGCNLLVNDNVGAVSWDWDYSNYDLIKKKTQSQNNFWKTIKDVLQSSNNMVRETTKSNLE